MKNTYENKCIQFMGLNGGANFLTVKKFVMKMLNVAIIHLYGT